MQDEAYEVRNFAVNQIDGLKGVLGQDDFLDLMREIKKIG